MPDDSKPKRGRPRILTDEEREQRKKKKNRRDNERRKAQGWTAQKKNRESHREQYYEPKVRIPSDKKEVLLRLMSQTGLSVTQLLVGAAEEKYGVVLHNDQSRE